MGAPRINRNALAALKRLEEVFRRAPAFAVGFHAFFFFSRPPMTGPKPVA